MARVPVRLKETGEVVGHVSQRLARKLKIAPQLRETARHLRRMVKISESWAAYHAHQRRLAQNPAVVAFRQALAREEDE